MAWSRHVDARGSCRSYAKVIEIITMDNYTQVDFKRSALITIDTQLDTLDGQPLEIPGTSAALPNMLKLLQAFRERGLLIVHIVRIYKRDGTNVDLCRRRIVEGGAQMLLEGHPGCELADTLFPYATVCLDHELLLSGGIQSIGQNESIIYKSRWGAFYKTPLEEHLRKAGVNSLVFSGCNFPNCPRTSIYEASERDFRIALAEDAISGLYPKGKSELENVGVLVATTKELLNELQA
jgi:nicotinamidase-related amidase